tara:strand:- start:201 stop:470 length:270 start_codon:yes stop_codon:yes gene_type:complete
MMILILLTREDERNERGQNAQNTTTEKIEKATLLWQRERFAKVSVFFCFARGKSAVFARFAFVSLVVLQVCVVENLKGKVSLSLSLCVI